jgi:hypothetical protein
MIHVPSINYKPTNVKSIPYIKEIENIIFELCL